MSKLKTILILVAITSSSPLGAADLPENIGAHYLCNVATEKDPTHPGGRITMKDQFGPARARIAKLKYVCSPTSKKWRDGDGSEHNTPQFKTPLHFVCYELVPQVLFKRATISNQFTNHEMKPVAIGNRELLCVPSFKELAK